MRRRCLRERTVWTSGTKSWFALAAQGVWVQGCAEGLGAEAAAALVAEPVLRLPPLAHWNVLTHAPRWNPGRPAAGPVRMWSATYAVAETACPTSADLAAATHVFWSSTAQFERGRHWCSADAHHASGPGKTAEHIRSAGVRNFRAFPSVTEWRKWTAKAR